MRSAELSDDFIKQLLGSSKTKGQYLTCLKEFVDSDEPIVNPREAWPLLFADKKASAMYQSFNNAKTKMNGQGENIRIINRDDEVFIMHTHRVELRLNPESAEV